MKTTAIHSLRRAGLAALAGAFALSLAACQAEEPVLEADAEDMSGEDLVVSTDDPEAVDVNLPETPMTPVPEDGAAEEAAAE